jgi:hypothetical protein
LLSIAARNLIDAGKAAVAKIECRSEQLVKPSSSVDPVQTQNM